MSKFLGAIEIFFDNLFCIALFCVAIFALYVGWDYVTDWFHKPESWIEAERIPGSYSSELDEKWVSSIFDSIKVKAKMRDSITSDKSDKLDFAYEVKARLTPPVLSKKNPHSEVDYDINISFKFIDDDGFIIGSSVSGWFAKRYMHEKYKRTELDYIWGETENKDVVVKALLNNRIPPNVAKRVKKIVYEAEIKVSEHHENNPFKKFGEDWRRLDPLEF